MAASSPAGPGPKTEIQSWRDRRDNNVSPDRTVVWTEPLNPKLKKVSVLYYLSRNGQLEHPHFMEVPLSSSHGGLFLRDVISRLNLLRGEGMASLYSWSCKRSFKNGFVWHDLSESDFIHPTIGHEYVLKGSELPDHLLLDMASPSPSQRRRNHSCSSIDFECSVNKAESSDKSAAADASTQTVEIRRRRKKGSPAEEDNGKRDDEVEIEICVSPAPSDSSPETLETLMKADGRAARRVAAETAASGHHEHVQRPCKSSVLMQLISCGSMPFKDCGAGQGLGLIGPNKTRTPRGLGTTAESEKGNADEKEYLSGSLDQAKKEEFPSTKRSTSYITDGSSPASELPEAVKAKCIPRKPKPQSS